MSRVALSTLMLALAGCVGQQDRDHNYRAYIGEHDRRIVFRFPEGQDPLRYDDILKITRESSHLVISAPGDLPSGRENAIDINDASHHILIRAGRIVATPETRSFITIKGGSHHIRIEGELVGEPRYAVDIGLWSDQNQDPVHAVDLTGLAFPPGSVVHVWHGEPPAVPDGVEIRTHEIRTPLWFWWKRLTAGTAG